MSKKLRGPSVNISFDSRAVPVMIDGIANTILEVMKKFTEFKDQRALWLASLPEDQRRVVLCGVHGLKVQETHEHRCNCHHDEPKQEEVKHACTHHFDDGRDAVVLADGNKLQCLKCGEAWKDGSIDIKDIQNAVNLMNDSINKIIWCGRFDQDTIDRLTTIKTQLNLLPNDIARASNNFDTFIRNARNASYNAEVKPQDDHEQQVVKQFKDDVRDLENKYGKYVEDLPRASAEEDFDDDDGDGSYWDDGCPSCDDEDGDEFSDNDSGIHEDLNDHYRERVHELYGDHCDDSCDKVTNIAQKIVEEVKQSGIEPMILLNRVRELWKQD